MNLTKNEIDEMNKVQLTILEVFIKVCKQLDLTYYMVHGSLLGAIQYNGFFPYDDDIDIAMHRKDYDILLREGNTLLPPNLFLQSCKTESNYPLEFAKLRDSSTTFIQNEMKNLNINQGIYIDIFPIDNYPNNRLLRFWKEILSEFYQARISAAYSFYQRQPLWKKAARSLAMLLYPSWKKAVNKRSALFSVIKKTGYVQLTGGKTREKGIPIHWFGDGVLIPFESLQVRCPSSYKQYLTQIYGDYNHYNPASKYMNPDGTVAVSADVFSTKHSYREM